MRADAIPILPRSTIRISIVDMISLGVRATKPPKVPPKSLFQKLPESAMTLMATVPRGIPAVSIPQNGMYPILSSPPKGTEDIVIVHFRKPSNQYEAVEVLYGGRSFTPDHFIDFAERWVQKNLGGLESQPGRYAYFSPSRDQWEVILRDDGYVVLDPSAMVFDVSAEVVSRRREPLSSGVIARVPVRTGTKMSVQGRPFASFARVDVTLDPDPGNTWMGFVEFRRARIIQSCPPESIAMQFREWMRLLAKESGFESWSFKRGMFCGDRIEWWGYRNRRRTLHEGIDFAEGLPPNAALQNIPEGTPVRALAGGEVVAVLDDYLNQTVVVRHSAVQNDSGAVFHSLFSHIHPVVSAPVSVGKGQLLGTVGKSAKSGAPAHLHLTGAWIPESIASDKMTIDLIHPAFTPIVLVNFNSLISSS